MNQRAAVRLRGDSRFPHAHTHISQATAATSTPTHVLRAASERTEGEESCSPEERDEELHQIHEVTVLGEGDLRGRERTRQSQESAL